MEYFKHRVKDKDVKIDRLNREYPYAGYATYFFLLEMIGEKGKDGKLPYADCLEHTALYFMAKHADVERVIKTAIDLGMFIIEDNNIFCPKLIGEYSDEWSVRRRRKKMLEDSGEDESIATAKYFDTVKEVLSYLNQKTGKQYRWTSKDSQVAIIARLKEKYTKEDLFQVIDNQCERWLGDEKMEVYLRPITLFARSKIEGYLNNNKGLVSKMKDWGKK